MNKIRMLDMLKKTVFICLNFVFLYGCNLDNSIEKNKIEKLINILTKKYGHSGFLINQPLILKKMANEQYDLPFFEGVLCSDTILKHDDYNFFDNQSLKYEKLNWSDFNININVIDFLDLKDSIRSYVCFIEHGFGTEKKLIPIEDYSGKNFFFEYYWYSFPYFSECEKYAYVHVAVKAKNSYKQYAFVEKFVNNNNEWSSYQFYVTY